MTREIRAALAFEPKILTQEGGPPTIGRRASREVPGYQACILKVSPRLCARGWTVPSELLSRGYSASSRDCCLTWIRSTPPGDVWFLSPFYSRPSAWRHPPPAPSAEKVSTPLDIPHESPRTSCRKGSAQPSRTHRVADPRPLRSPADHRLACLREPQPDTGGSSLGVCRERAEVGRPAVADVAGLRDRDAGRVEPEGLDEGPLHGPGDEAVAVDEGAHCGDLGVHEACDDGGRAATTVGAGAGPRSTSSEQPSSPTRGRPSASPLTTGEAAATCRRASAWSGAVRTSETTRSLSAVAATAPLSVSSPGSRSAGQSRAPLISSRTTSTGNSAPSSAALAWAPRTRDSAPASGMRRRSASWKRSFVHASRAASARPRTSGRSVRTASWSSRAACWAAWWVVGWDVVRLGSGTPFSLGSPARRPGLPR